MQQQPGLSPPARGKMQMGEGEESREAPAANEYAVDSIIRACAIMRSFRSKGESLRLRDIVARTGMHKATAFRTAQSLVIGGLLERSGRDQYQSRIHSIHGQRVKLGYAAMTAESVFSREVTSGLRLATRGTEFDLVECDNRYSAAAAIRNAKRLVKEQVALAIEVQIHEDTAPAVAEIFREANIPLIAVDIPHPGATFLGGNNYLAGRIGGHALARWAVERWESQVDVVVLLTLEAAGALPLSRMTGMAVGIKELLPKLDDSHIIQIDARGGYVESMRAMSAFLQKFRGGRMLVGAMNDASALGALRALNESRRKLSFAVVGQNASSAARAELRVPGTNLIGSVSFFPETYGKYLVKIARELLEGKPAPPATFVKHVLITSENVNHHYPNDVLIDSLSPDTLLWNYYH